MIRINTLGSLSVRGENGQPLAGAAAQPRRTAILAVLARAGERGVTRDKLLALLWPDADDERGPGALAQALYALRRDLGADAIVGAKDLRFDPALVATDVAEFTTAVARGDDERAVAIYHGPFLDGFHLPNADAFSRWVEQERNALAHDHARSLESLARGARTRGDATEAVGWWRKLAALDPLNARVTVGLMDALVAAGDRAGALKHVNVYRVLVEQELELPPDREVLAFAERLKQEVDEGPASAPEPVLPEPRPTRHGPVGMGVTGTWRATHRHARGAFVLSLVAVGLASAAFAVTRTRYSSSAAPGGDNDSAHTVVAIGRIDAFGTDSAQANLAAPVADLLATSLARARGIHVVSRSRMLELMRSARGVQDTTSAVFMDAARNAGASELIDGTLYARPGGRLRLDLRRIDVATGAIGDVHTTEGADLFALVDSGTALVVSALGVARPNGSVADLTTRSLTAYRMYERGIQAYYRGDWRSALGLFDAALAEDSLFAMAAYYDALAAASRDKDQGLSRLVRAKNLAARASDRERLFILGGWAYRTSSPSLRPIAETLSVRYPTEVEGYLYTGITHVLDGSFLAAVAPLERVISMNSAALRGSGADCAACEAFRWLVSAYELSDSLSAAERVARRWVRLQPGSTTAIEFLVETIDWSGRATEADSLARANAAYGAGGDALLDFRAMHLVRASDYATADSLLTAATRIADARRLPDAYWNLAISLRQQGRLDEAWAATRQMRRVTDRMVGGTPPSNAILEARILLEQGRAAASAALLDSLKRAVNPEPESESARRRAWLMTQIAEARIATGDTASLARLADSIRVLGEASGFGRDRRLYHHVLGRLYALRGDDSRAIAELRVAIYSSNAGYTRTNYELARIYLRERQPREAIITLQPALRGSMEASNLYLARTEIHELLAQAWDAAGVRDSAAAHYKIVVTDWASADSQFAPRVRAANARLAALAR